MSPEEMQAEILRLTEANATQTLTITGLESAAQTTVETIASMTTEATVKAAKITELQAHAQKLFLMITKPVEDKTPEPEPLSLEELAKTLTF